MINIIKQELDIDERVRMRIDFICGFTNTKPKYIVGSLWQIEKINLVYWELHRVIKGLYNKYILEDDDINCIEKKDFEF